MRPGSVEIDHHRWNSAPARTHACGPGRARVVLAGNPTAPTTGHQLARRLPEPAKLQFH